MWRVRDEAKDRKLYYEVDGIVRYRYRLWVPSGDSLREVIMREAHDTPYSIRLGNTKMYKDLQLLKCRSPIHWDEVGERGEFSSDLIKQTTELVVKIRDRIKTAQSRQKSYADKHQRELEFAVGDHVFVKVAPLKGDMRFDKKGKLSPRFIGPFEILEKIKTLAYRVALPPMLARVHNVFYILMLRNYMSNPSHVLNNEPLQLTPNMTYEERPIQILAMQEGRLRNKIIPMIKVKWLNHSEE
ncbi:uncharacterized protein [Primulina huaijiensis]|uniref:uncharacterized protein n=1 Tax=Primulina huaijiensis TaxID=1492673 RepID=UPI003CC6EF8C